MLPCMRVLLESWRPGASFFQLVFVPRGNFGARGDFTPKGNTLVSLEDLRIKQRIFNPGSNFTTRGQLYLWGKLHPWRSTSHLGFNSTRNHGYRLHLWGQLHPWRSTSPRHRGQLHL
jgi:hypothetical protein